MTRLCKLDENKKVKKVIAGVFDKIFPVVRKVTGGNVDEKVSIFLLCLPSLSDACFGIYQQQKECGNISFSLFFDASLSNNLSPIQGITQNHTTSTVEFKDSVFLNSRCSGCEINCTSLLHTIDCPYIEMKSFRGVADLFTSKISFAYFFKLISTNVISPTVAQKIHAETKYYESVEAVSLNYIIERFSSVSKFKFYNLVTFHIGNYNSMPINF